MTEIVNFPGITKLALPVERILDEAAKKDFDRIVIVGVLKDGSEYFATSEADGGCTIWDLERAKHKLMMVVDDDQRS